MGAESVGGNIKGGERRSPFKSEWEPGDGKRGTSILHSINVEPTFAIV